MSSGLAWRQQDWLVAALVSSGLAWSNPSGSRIVVAAGLVSSSPDVIRVGSEQPWWQQVWVRAALVAAGLVSSSPGV